MLGKARSLEWVTPVLYVRGETTQLFSVATSERDGRHHDKPMAQESKSAAGWPAPTPPPETRPTIPMAGLRAMYVQARAELRAERYAAAIGLFDDLLSLDPGHRDAAVLRDDAVRRRDLADKFQQAVHAQTAEDWSTAARLYEQVLDVQPDYPEAVIRRQRCEKAQHIIDLQDELRIHAESKNWRALVDVSDELAPLDPAAADPDGLATQARSALRAQSEATELEERYEQARECEENGDWTTAIGRFGSLSGYRDADTRVHTCQQRQHEADIAKGSDPDNSDPGGIMTDSRAKIRDAELADRKPREPAEVAQRATPPLPLTQATTPAAPRTIAPPVPVATGVRRRWQIAAVVGVVLALVGGLTIAALRQGPNSSSTATTTPMSAAPAPPTSTEPPGPTETITGYLTSNDIQQTKITPGTPGAPKVDLPVPEGWAQVSDDPTPRTSRSSWPSRPIPTTRPR